MTTTTVVAAGAAAATITSTTTTTTTHHRHHHHHLKLRSNEANLACALPREVLPLRHPRRVRWAHGDSHHHVPGHRRRAPGPSGGRVLALGSDRLTGFDITRLHSAIRRFGGSATSTLMGMHGGVGRAPRAPCQHMPTRGSAACHTGHLRGFTRALWPTLRLTSQRKMRT